MRFLRRAEVRKRLSGISNQTLWRMERAGLLKSYSVAGGRLRGYLEDDLEKFIQGRVEAGAAPCAFPVPVPRQPKKAAAQ